MDNAAEFGSVVLEETDPANQIRPTSWILPVYVVLLLKSASNSLLSLFKNRLRWLISFLTCKILLVFNDVERMCKRQLKNVSNAL